MAIIHVPRGGKYINTYFSIDIYFEEYVPRWSLTFSNPISIDSLGL